MTRTLLATAAALTIGFSADAAEPVNSETLVDRAELIRIADGLDTAVDAKDWAAARAFFADEVTVDFGSLTGTGPVTIPSDALIAGWQGNLTAEKTSFHLRGNHAVEFDGADAATVTSQGYAWNRLERGALPENGGEALWEVWGSYTHGFTRTEAGWKINEMRLSVSAERGNPFVRNTPGN